MNVLPYIKSRNLKFDEIKDEISSHRINLGGWLAPALASFSISLAFFLSGIRDGFDVGRIIMTVAPWIITIVGYRLNKYFLSTSIEYANRNVGPPHEVIDGFLKWEEGDYIKTDHFCGAYKGVDKRKRIILETSSKYVCLSTGYFDSSSKVKNQNLENRRKRKAKNRIEKEVDEETHYEQLIDEFKEEYNRLET